MRPRALVRVEIGLRHQIDEIGIAGFGRGDQHHGFLLTDMRGLAAARAGRRQIAVEHQIELAAGNGLDALLRRLLGEFQRAEQITGIGDADGRHAVRGGEADDLLQRQRAFEQRVGRMDPQMDKTRPGRSRLIVMRFGRLFGHVLSRFQTLRPALRRVVSWPL